jgi:hypothetical protein
LEYVTFREKKLTCPNPTFYVFSAPMTKVRAAIRQTFTYNAQEPGSQLIIDTSSPSKIELYQLGLVQSDVYFSRGTPLGYKATFSLLLSSVSDSQTRIEVETSEAQVLMGGASLHGGNNYKWVHPTAIEEYEIILRIGATLGEPRMPGLQLPGQCSRQGH